MVTRPKLSVCMMPKMSYDVMWTFSIDYVSNLYMKPRFLELRYHFTFKVELSPSKKNCFICFNESSLKMMKNAFYFILKALFVFKIFIFLSRHFVHVGETAWLNE